MRNSKQRELILNIINTSYCHPTAEIVYEKARSKMPQISLGTVYRNLDMLQSLGTIRRINLKDNTYRYDRAIDNHAHFVCNKCGKIIDIPENLFENLDKISGNKILSCDIILKGICKECLKREE